MGLEDYPLLCFIKQKFGGNIKPRTGANAYRYRLHNKKGMIELVRTVNGFIRHSTRLIQLEKVCAALGLIIIYP
jgi:hypothetical protein